MPATEIIIHPLIQKMNDTIKDLIPQDDKSHLNSYIFDLDMPDNEEGASVIKGFAAESFGMMARKYEAGFLILCGVIPRLKHNLVFTHHQHVITSIARACVNIALSGGATELVKEGFQEQFIHYVRDESQPGPVRMECARAYGVIHAMVTIEKEKEVYKLLR
jgi:hypothetical protein